MIERLTDEVFKAAINCSHTIDADTVILEYDASQPGHNALNQLHFRINQAIARVITQVIGGKS